MKLKSSAVLLKINLRSKVFFLCAEVLWLNQQALTNVFWCRANRAAASFD